MLSEDVIPAFAWVADFMRKTYLPGANKELGALALPNGRAYYGALVRYFTTLDDATPESIHQRNEAFAPPPDLLLLLEIPPQQGLDRIAQQRERDGFERLDYLERVAAIFAAMRFNPHR